MINPFARRYKIIECSNPSATFYSIKYGNIFTHTYITNKGEELDYDGYSYTEHPSLESAKEAIKTHANNLITNRLNKTISKTIQYV